MLKAIIDQVCAELRSFSPTPVYSSFDAVPVTKKPGGIYTVVGIESFSSTASIYSPYIVYIPFSAQVSIRLTAPQECSLDELYDYYSRYTGVAIRELTGLCCHLEKLSAKYDSNINRLVLTALFHAEGITRIERSSE